MTPHIEFHLEAAGPFPDLKRLERLARFVLTAEGAEGSEVGVALTDDAGIQALNRAYLGRDEPTDVLAFPLEETGGRPALVVGKKGRPYLGDVAVSLERAREQAPSYGHSWEEECETLLVHGLLHLLGYDDGTEAERRRMEVRQERLLDAFQQPRSLLFSFRAAFAGLGNAVRTQRNMAVHLGIAVLVLALGALVGLTPQEWALLLLTIALVLAAETFNTALEAVVDLASPERRPLARRAKDLAAAAVLLAALFSVAIGVVLFLPHLREILLGK
ncbi:MAG: rRNA maturation RNase YbeY [Chloroflexia bacterium]